MLITRNRKHRRATAKPAACTKSLILSTLGREGRIYVGKEGGEVEKEVGRAEGRRKEGGRKEVREEGRETGR